MRALPARAPAYSLPPSFAHLPVGISSNVDRAVPLGVLLADQGNEPLYGLVLWGKFLPPIHLLVPRLVVEGGVEEDSAHVPDLLQHLVARMQLCAVPEIARVQVINVVPLHVKHDRARAVVGVDERDGGSAAAPRGARHEHGARLQQRQRFDAAARDPARHQEHLGLLRAHDPGARAPRPSARGRACGVEKARHVVGVHVREQDEPDAVGAAAKPVHAVAAALVGLVPQRSPQARRARRHARRYGQACCAVAARPS